MTTLFETRQNSLLTLTDGNVPAVPMTRMGFPALMTKWDMFALAGRMYNLKQTAIGTALSGATAAGGSIVLTVPWVRFAIPSGYTLFPHHFNLSISAAAGTACEIVLAYSETDTFTSGGTALTPLNWRTDNPRDTSVTRCYVGPTGGANVEGAQVRARVLYQDCIPAAFAVQVTNQYTIDIWYNDLIPIIGPATILLWFGGATTTPAGYFSLDWAEVATSNVKEA